MAGVMSSSCGACKFLRRKCTEGCVFAPYFSYDQGAIHFAAVHKVFGASNVSKLLLHLPINHRGEAAATVSFEAQARMRDPVYGCVAYIFALQQQVVRLQEEIESITNQLLASCLNIDQCMDQPSPHTMDTLFQSFHHCMHKEDYNNIYGSTNLHMRISNVQDSFNSTNGEEVAQERLHPVFREAIDRLEHSLLSDLT